MHGACPEPVLSCFALLTVPNPCLEDHPTELLLHDAVDVTIASFESLWPRDGLGRKCP